MQFLSNDMHILPENVSQPGRIRVEGGVHYGIATKVEEQKQARYLIYGVFMQELGFVSVRPDQFDASAVYVVGKKSSAIIAAVRIVLDSEDGLPLDGYYDLSALRSRAYRLVEVGRLACHPDHRTNLVALRGRGSMIRAAANMGASHLVIDSLIELTPLYRRIGFSPVGEPFVDPTVQRSNEHRSAPNAQVMWAAIDELRGW